MRCEEAYRHGTESRLRQEGAARWLGVCERTFRRYLDRYEDEGLDGLIDQRLRPVSHRRAPVDEVRALTERYRRRHDGWNVKHCYAWYRRDEGARSDPWVKNTRQGAGWGVKGKQRGPPRRRRYPDCWCTRTPAGMHGGWVSTGLGW